MLGLMCFLQVNDPFHFSLDIITVDVCKGSTKRCRPRKNKKDKTTKGLSIEGRSRQAETDTELIHSWSEGMEWGGVSLD